MHYISILSTLVTFGFAWVVFERYRRRGGTHLLLWGFGLVLFGLGTLTEAVMVFTFSPLALKCWYLTGAMLTAAWLGQGTVHLLVRKGRVAATLSVLLGLVSLLAVGLVATAPLTPAAATFNVNAPVSAQYKEILVRSSAMIFLTVLLNLYGTLGLVGGALYSAFLFWRKRVLFDRMLGNILIAAGALLPALAGSFIKAGLADWLYLSEFLGVVLMFTGFLRATAARTAAQPATVSAQ